MEESGGEQRCPDQCRWAIRADRAATANIAQRQWGRRKPPGEASLLQARAGGAVGSSSVLLICPAAGQGRTSRRAVDYPMSLPSSLQAAAQLPQKYVDSSILGVSCVARSQPQLPLGSFTERCLQKATNRSLGTCRRRIPRANLTSLSARMGPVNPSKADLRGRRPFLERAGRNAHPTRLAVLNRCGSGGTP